MVNIQVRFPNLSQAPRTEVTYTTLPFAQGDWNGATPLKVIDEYENEIDADIQPFGARWLDGSVRYARLLARVSYEPHGTRTMRVVDGTQVNQQPFIFHDSIIASAGKVAIKLAIKVNGQWMETDFHPPTAMLEAGRLRMVFACRERMGNFVTELKTYVASRQQLIKFELSVTGSDPSTTITNYPVEDMRLYVEGNCYLNIRGAAKRGVSVNVPYKDFRLMANDYFGDGQKQSWYGEFLLQLDLSQPDQVGNAIAALEYPVYGMAMNWGTTNAFASLGAIQQPDAVDIAGYWVQLVAQFRQYNDFITTQGNVWDDYMLGVTKTPGQTGDQADFGCLEGGPVLFMGAAELLDELYFMATEETKRPGHYYETNCQPVSAVNHPDWVVWSGRTHWHPAVSPDKLGKTADFASDNHGWDGKDWEHHSSNLLSLTSLLTGSYLLLDEVNNEVELYIAGHTLPSVKPGWSTNSMFAPRAFGRTHHAMCNHYLLNGNVRLRDHMLKRFMECVLPQWDGATRSPVKNWTHVRDWRVLGAETDAWVPWNESLGFVGVVALYNVTRDRNVLNTMIQWGNTILNYGWRAKLEGEIITDLVIGAGVKWYDDGHPLTDAEYNNLASFTDGDGLKLWGAPVLHIIKNNAGTFGQSNADKAARYASKLKTMYPVDSSAPFSEYGQWVAIRLAQ